MTEIYRVEYAYGWDNDNITTVSIPQTTDKQLKRKLSKAVVAAHMAFYKCQTQRVTIFTFTKIDK